MPVVSLVNRKGGVGKTTLTLALSDYLSSVYRKKVLLIDLDPQANLTTAGVGETRWQALDRGRLTVADLFQAVVSTGAGVPHIERVTRVTRGSAVDLIASTPRLSDVEEDVLEGDAGWRRRMGSPYVVLSRGLGDLVDTYDYVLIDCPPALGMITLNGLALSDGYLIPVMPSPIAVSGLELLAAKVNEFGAGLRRKLVRYGTVVNRVKVGTLSHAAIIGELERNPEAKPVWNARIRDSVRAEEEWDQHGASTLIQRWGTLHTDFSALAEEFVRRVR